MKMKPLQSDGKEEKEPKEIIKNGDEKSKSHLATPEPVTPSSAEPEKAAAHNAIKIWQRRKKQDDNSEANQSFTKEKMIRDTLNSSSHKLPKGSARLNTTSTRNIKLSSSSNANHATKPSSSNPLKATESRNSNVVRKVLANLKTTRAKRRWRYALETEDMNEEYMVNYYRAQNEKVDMSGLEGAGKLWPGKDYVNYIHKDFVNVEDPFSDFTDRFEVPRMPWRMFSFISM